MPEIAKKYQKRVVQFPQQPASESHITMSESELQEMIRDIVEAARKKKQRKKPTNSIYTNDGRLKPTPADPIRSKSDFRKVANYLATNGDPKFRLRNKVIFVFGCSIGIRCGDLLNLRTSDVYEANGSVKEHVELFEEKTRKRNVCKIPKMAVEALEEYRAEQDFEIGQNTYLFRSRKGGPLNVRSFYHILKAAGEACGLDIDLSTHTMRKTYAMAALQTAEKAGTSGQTIEMLQEKFKHSSQRVTMHYVKVDQDRMDEMSDRISDWFDDGGDE